MARVNIPRTSALPLKALAKQRKQKKGKHFEKKKRYSKYEVNIMVQKLVKKALKQNKRKSTEELREFETMSISDSDQESFNSSSSEEGEISKLGPGELYHLDNYHSSKKSKQHTESFLNLDDCINDYYNYESLHSRLVS